MEQQYVVSVSNIFDADTPEDAVLQMAEWLLDSAYRAGYRVARYGVVDSHKQSVFIDAEMLNIRSCDDCGRQTDAGEFPDWINGVCENCDPSILT